MDPRAASAAPLAKLSRPQTAGLIPRPRLFARLERACARGTVWVCAPGGAGKTSLLATWIEAGERAPLWYRVDADDSDAATLVHYLGRLAAAHAPGAPPLPALTPEYLEGLATFARRFLRDLYAHLPAPFVLVMDDVHEIGSDSPAQHLLSVALAEVPPGSALVLCGRSAPPPALARFALHESALTWEDLQLDGDEARALLADRAVTGNWDVDALRTLTQGWAAGFSLLASRPCEARAPDQPLLPDMGDTLCAYFRHEILARSEAAERACLLATAPLATFTLAQAEALSDRRDAAALLERLRGRQCFITRFAGEPPTYRCHPLFHAFLRDEAQRLLPAPAWRELCLRAGALAAAAGAIETAASLYLEIHAWAELSALLGQAASRLVAQGRHALLEQWIGQIPTAERDRSPWLLYWLGTAQLYSGRMRSGRILLERAYADFDAAGERDGWLLAWGGIIESYNFEWDDVSAVAVWATRIERALPEDLPNLPTPVMARLLGAGITLELTQRAHAVTRRLVELAGVVLGRPDLVAAQGPAMSLALIHRLCSGDFGEAQAMLALVTGAPEFLDWPPLGRMAFGQLGAICAWQTGLPERAYELVEQVLGQAEETGIHGTDFVTLAQGVYAALSVRDAQRSLAYLARLQTLIRPDRRGDAAHLDALLGCQKLLAGDLPGARGDLERAIELLQHLGIEFGALVARAMYVWVLALQGEFDRARVLIQETLAHTRAARTASIEFESQVALAYTEMASGQCGAAREALREAFALGRQRRYFVTGPVWLPEAMSLLCAEALEVGIEPDYARELIARRELVPPSPEVEHWPWPVRIHTLGRFGVVVAGHPLRFQRKSPGRPIRLLQALLALGGREVVVSALIEALWPDAEGDAAANAFHVTLLRLRRLLGEPALTLSDHRLSVNDRYCWVDAWAFERLAARGEGALVTGGVGGTGFGAIAEQMLGRYRGPFLAGEDAGWAAVARARLRSRFLRLLGGCARRLREEGDCEAAAFLCRRALEIEPLAEDLLLELVRALVADERRAQATAIAREANVLFQRLLGRPVSPALWRLIDV